MNTLASLTALYDATRALGLSRDFDALLDEVLQRAGELIDYEACALFLPEGGLLRARRARGYGASLARLLELRLKLNEGLAGRAAMQRQAVRLHDVSRERRHVPALDGARSVLAVPLLLRNEVLGVLYAESPRVEAFSEEQEKLLTILGTQAALAIEASRSRERTEQRLRELNALYRISQLAAEPRDLDGVLPAMLQAVQEVLPHSQSVILLLDEETRTLRLRAALGYEAGAPCDHVPLGQGLLGRCAERGETLLVEEAVTPAAGCAARSEIAVPLLAEGRVIGVLGAESPQAGALTQEHARTLAMVAQQAATVLRAAQLHEETRRLAITDPLTGLYNRRHFVLELEEHLRRVRRYGGRLSVVVLDLDGLKPLNDQHGHGAGDQALQQLAALMRAWVRDSDLVARIGGDEFAAVLLEADAAEVRQVVERLRRSVERAPLRLAGGTFRLTLSGGVALFPRDGNDSKSLLLCADGALYEAKRQGRNRVLMAGEAPAAAGVRP